MSATPVQAEQALYGGSTSEGEVDLNTPFQGHEIDWNNLDSVPSEVLSVLADFWDNPITEVATGATEAWNGSEVFRTPSPAATLQPGLRSHAVEEISWPTRKLDDLDFFNLGVFEWIGNDQFNAENAGVSGSLHDFDNPPNLPKAQNVSQDEPFSLDLPFGNVDHSSQHPQHNNQEALAPFSIQVMFPELTAGDAATQGCLSGDSPDTDNTDGIEIDGQRPKSRSATAEPSQTKTIRLAKMNTNFMININYTPLSTKPRPWHIFTYTEHGELNPKILFTTEEIQHYLWRHPLHKESNDCRDSPLTLRIHRTPPASQDRYPTNYGSHRCRFQKCPADNNTIDKGQFVVMFDELSAAHPNHDPYLTAGYVHLYCLERFLDFPRICAHLNVQTEKRHFNKEVKNLMKLHPKQVEEEADRFIEACRESKGRRPDGYPSFAERDEVTGQPYNRTLTHRMHLAKLTNRSGSINKQERARVQTAGQKGSSLEIHLGDLVLATALRQDTRIHTKQNKLIANPRQKRKYKGDRVEVGSENGSDNKERGDSEGDGRAKQLRCPLPPCITSTTQLLRSNAQQPDGDKFLATRGNITQSLAPQYSVYQPDENRKFVIPTENLLSPASLQPQQSRQSQQRIKPSNAQSPVKVSAPASPVEHQQQGDPEISRKSKKRSSDEAGNDKAGNYFGRHIAKFSPQNSLDAGARPTKKVKESHFSVPSSLALKQAHQRQALQRKVNLRALPPPPPPPQQRSGQPSLHLFPPPYLQADNKRKTNEAGLGAPPTQMAYSSGLLSSEAGFNPDKRQSKKLKQTQDPPMMAPTQVPYQQGHARQQALSTGMSSALAPASAPPAAPAQSQCQQSPPLIAGKKHTRVEAEKSIDDDVVYGNPMASDETFPKKPRIWEQAFQTPHAEHRRAPSGNVFTSMRSFPDNLGRNLPYQPQKGYQEYPALDHYGLPQPGHPPPQDFPPGSQQGYTPPKHHPYSLQQGYPSTQDPTPGCHPETCPQQRPPQGYQLQQASDTPELRKQINENYERYVRQNRRRKNSPKPRARKRPAEVLGNDGKVIKRRQRMATKTPGMDFGVLSEGQLLPQQQELFATARKQEELRAEKERAARQQGQNEQEMYMRQREAAEENTEQSGSQIAQFRAEEEREARQKTIEAEQDEAEFRAEEERAASQRDLAKDTDWQRDLYEQFLNSTGDDEDWGRRG